MPFDNDEVFAPLVQPADSVRLRTAQVRAHADRHESIMEGGSALVASTADDRRITLLVNVIFRDQQWGLAFFEEAAVRLTANAASPHVDALKAALAKVAGAFALPATPALQSRACAFSMRIAMPPKDRSNDHATDRRRRRGI